MNRRAFLGGVAAIVTGGAGATAASLAIRRRGDTLRVGVMTNLTHAPLLAGLGSGRIARALAPVAAEARLFRAGPRVVEALLGDAIDVGVAGPSPIVVHHARRKGRDRGLRVLSGCASGGASFMIAKASGIARAEDLRGRRVAVTQVGTTQDVALRTWLRRRGLREAAAGGDVSVVAVAPSVILDQMRRGNLDGAWLAEPWATRLEVDLGATRLVDERDLWEDRMFCSAALVTRAGRETDPPLVRLEQALAEEISRARRSPGETLAEAYAELSRHVGNPGSRATFEAAAGYIDYTPDPIRSSFARFAEDAAALGMIPNARAEHGLFV